jgi:hypothetical protein
MLHRCAWPGCDAEGGFRAPRSPRKLPRSPQDLQDHLWFCLQHVRQYNATWNYYAGMDETQVEADLRRDQVWQRPSWRMGGGGDGFRARLHDPLDILGGKTKAPPARPLTPVEMALAELDLTYPVTEAALKTRYKVLVKEHHPDRNNGDKEAEERFKKISQAYRTVMDSLAS